MLSSRSVTDFQIRTVEGQILTGSIEELEILAKFILERGLSAIAKVSLYITDTERPHEFCNVILRNRNGRFVPEFATTWQDGDWDIAMQSLQYGNLDDMFVRHIQDAGIVAN